MRKLAGGNPLGETPVGLRFTYLSEQSPRKSKREAGEQRQERGGRGGNKFKIATICHHKTEIEPSEEPPSAKEAQVAYLCIDHCNQLPLRLSTKEIQERLQAKPDTTEGAMGVAAPGAEMEEASRVVVERAVGASGVGGRK